MVQTNPVIWSVGEILGAVGYKKHGSSWYRRSTETVVVVNLQRSQYSSVYYLNYGIWILSVEELSFPQAHKCHVVGRARELLENHDEMQEFDRLLTADENLDDAVRLTALASILSIWVLPLLDRALTIAGLREGQGAYLIRNSLLRRDAIPLLASTE